MAIEQHLKSKSFKSSDDLTSKQYHLVKLSGGEIKSVASSTDNVVGVLQNEPEAGETASVAYGGISKVVSGSDNMSVGDYVVGNTESEAVPVSASADTVRRILGVVTVAASSGEVGSVMIDKQLG